MKVLAVHVSNRPTTIKIDVPAGHEWRVVEVVFSPWEGSELAAVVLRRPHPRNKTGTAEFAWGSYDFERNRLRVDVDVGMNLEDLAPLVCTAVCDAVEADHMTVTDAVQRLPRGLVRRWIQEEYLRSLLTSEVANEDEQ